MALPPIKLDHLKALTDDTGILQHAKYSTPQRSQGYTTDDNARALLACIKYHQLFNNDEMEKLIDTYLSFLLHMQRPDGKFHNLLSYECHFKDEVGSEDCMGRALWACGYVVNSRLTRGKTMLSKQIFDKGLKWISTFPSLRAKAYTILGLQYYAKAFPQDNNLILNTRTLTDQLCENYHRTASSDWQWFEPYMTYANARLPHALFEAYRLTRNDYYLQLGRASLDFLIQHQVLDNMFVPVGNKGFYSKLTEKAFYDQQPIEASCMVEAAKSAFHVTGDEKYLKIAHIAFSWFRGNNSRKLEVYDQKTGGCYDGITPQGINLNQGAESTICYLLARLELEKKVD
ncbi:MAG: glycosyltransferase [Candidatus Hodarchaeota archaeon]